MTNVVRLDEQNAWLAVLAKYDSEYGLAGALIDLSKTDTETRLSTIEFFSAMAMVTTHACSINETVLREHEFRLDVIHPSVAAVKTGQFSFVGPYDSEKVSVATVRVTKAMIEAERYDEPPLNVNAASYLGTLMVSRGLDFSKRFDTKAIVLLNYLTTLQSKGWKVARTFNTDSRLGVSVFKGDVYINVDIHPNTWRECFTLAEAFQAVGVTETNASANPSPEGK